MHDRRTARGLRFAQNSWEKGVLLRGYCVECRWWPAVETRRRASGIRGNCTRQTTNSRSSLSRSLPLSSNLPPRGPFLFVLLRAKPCCSFRRHAFTNVGEHERPDSAFEGIARAERTAGKSVRSLPPHPSRADCFMTTETHRALTTLPGNATNPLKLQRGV